jgi:hypothetical protein
MDHQAPSTLSRTYNMFLPFFGFLLSSAFFAGVGAVVLRLTGVRPVRAIVLLAFVVAAQAGLLVYVAVYGAIFADASNHLRSTGAVLGMLVGMPVAGSLTGLAAARLLARRLGHYRLNSM